MGRDLETEDSQERFKGDDCLRQEEAEAAMALGKKIARQAQPSQGLAPSGSFEWMRTRVRFAHE
jgi:hypothetical protein